MAVFNNALAGAAGSGGAAGYEIARSLRFNSGDSAYLNRTPASAGNRKTLTYSFWVKRSKIDGASTIRMFSGGPYTAPNYKHFHIRWEYDNLAFLSYDNNALQLSVGTTREFRDPSAWYHIVIAIDTTQAVQENRIKLYVNGVEEVYTSWASVIWPSQDVNLAFNSASEVNYIGARENLSTEFFDGYLADVHFIDGAALDPTDFGEFDDNGVWQPIEYSGSYNVGVGAVNGFHLPFSDNSSASALGTDDSGNGNDWTVNNISVASGAGNDSLLDSPTNGDTANDTGAGGEVPGNYCTANPLMLASPIALANGNLQVSGTNLFGTWKSQAATFAVNSGQYYWEATVSSASTAYGLGVAATENDLIATHYPGYTATSYGYHFDGTKINNASSSGYGSAFGAGTVIGVALNADNGQLTFYRNGISQGVAFTVTSGKSYYPIFGIAGGDTTQFDINFGQRPFAYSAPSGYKCLCTANLDTPTIEDGSTAMDVALDTGANILTSTKALCGGNANFLWIKDRANGSTNHHLIDIVRDPDLDGTPFLASNSPSDETTLGSYSPPSGNSVGWAWNAGTSNTTYGPVGSGSDVEDAAYSIQSTVRANPSAGFSIVTYTGNTSSNQTIGHGLGVAPEMIIAKSRSTTAGWIVYFSVLGRDGYLQLHATAAAGSATNYWGTADPTSTVFGTYPGGGASNNSGDMVAYCFAPVEGYSAFGSYNGNGSTTSDGPFVYTGFLTKFVLIKRYEPNSANDWYIFDAVRNTYNAINSGLFPSTNGNEITQTSYNQDFVSNGFKLRNNNDALNATGGSYIYAAFAEHPFRSSRAR